MGKESIENSLSEQLEWEELPEKKASRIKLASKCALSSQDNWGEYHSWMLEKTTHFQQIFSKHIKNVQINC